MEFEKINEHNWKAQIDYRELYFYAYGMSKQEAASKCFNEVQEYVDNMQNMLDELIKH